MQALSLIFNDESKLDMIYIPRDLPNREEHLKKLKNHFSGTPFSWNIKKYSSLWRHRDRKDSNSKEILSDHISRGKEFGK